MGRRLIYVPIIHTEVDMGSLAGSLKDEYIRKYGLLKWNQHLNKINELWAGIEERLNQKHLFPAQVKEGGARSNIRLYQDGLPVCGKELQIVQDVAGSGGKNHQLLLRLIAKGAILMGTEDPALLIKEYQLIKNAAMGKDLQGDASRHRGFMEERDKFIASRIDETLNDGETGILFLGMLHRVDEKLPADIAVEYLIYHLPFKEAVNKN